VGFLLSEAALIGARRSIGLSSGPEEPGEPSGFLASASKAPLLG